ncbi:hypothetical protein CH63R_12781 [Colletotrichum higginsianum IMI 349063]|uniref:Uncharacterized protein n=1 Tax=Colletotrichum higginsianum (strain IMI 349063) TaxID=759273 RepID=A0A1B7XV87_COLHI|nr:hypothetical protein CH63R_12781 [Colletotrichum higginsianum IMI 349063]OBR03654.1 hypothetical protein CH63R_12781 [Colletotrichum higginsianum IMI 349063]
MGKSHSGVSIHADLQATSRESEKRSQQELRHGDTRGNGSGKRPLFAAGVDASGVVEGGGGGGGGSGENREGVGGGGCRRGWTVATAMDQCVGVDGALVLRLDERSIIGAGG